MSGGAERVATLPFEMGPAAKRGATQPLCCWCPLPNGALHAQKAQAHKQARLFCASVLALVTCKVAGHILQSSRQSASLLGQFTTMQLAQNVAHPPARLPAHANEQRCVQRPTQLVAQCWTHLHSHHNAAWRTRWQLGMPSGADALQRFDCGSTRRMHNQLCFWNYVRLPLPPELLAFFVLAATLTTLPEATPAPAPAFLFPFLGVLLEDVPAASGASTSAQTCSTLPGPNLFVGIENSRDNAAGAL